MTRLVLFAALLLPTVYAQDAQHVFDGHVVERLQSITITPKQGAPFRATVITDWTRTLADGTRVTVKNRRTVARDSTGRIFQERRYLAADGDTNPTQISQLEYYDPVRKELTSCVPQQKLCTVQSWFIPQKALETCKPSTGPHVTITCDALGTGNISNLDTVGSRQIVTITGGPLGYKEPEPTIKEFWFSPRLELNLITKRFEPRGGAQNFTFQNIDLTEPDASLFTPPAGYKSARTIVQ